MFDFNSGADATASLTRYGVLNSIALPFAEFFWQYQFKP